MFETPRKLTFLLKIEDVPNELEPFSMSELERYFGFFKPQIDLRQLLKELINLKILIKTNQYGVDKFKIDRELLDNYIENTPLWCCIIERVKKTRTIWADL